MSLNTITVPSLTSLLFSHRFILSHRILFFHFQTATNNCFCFRRPPIYVPVVYCGFVEGKPEKHCKSLRLYCSILLDVAEDSFYNLLKLLSRFSKDNLHNLLLSLINAVATKDYIHAPEFANQRTWLRSSHGVDRFYNALLYYAFTLSIDKFLQLSPIRRQVRRDRLFCASRQ